MTARRIRNHATWVWIRVPRPAARTSSDSSRSGGGRRSDQWPEGTEWPGSILASPRRAGQHPAGSSRRTRGWPERSRDEQTEGSTGEPEPGPRKGPRGRRRLMASPSARRSASARSDSTSTSTASDALPVSPEPGPAWTRAGISRSTPVGTGTGSTTRIALAGADRVEPDPRGRRAPRTQSTQ